MATTDAFADRWDLACATGQSTDLDPELASGPLEGARLFLQPAFRGEDGQNYGATSSRTSDDIGTSPRVAYASARAGM